MKHKEKAIIVQSDDIAASEESLQPIVVDEATNKRISPDIQRYNNGSPGRPQAQPQPILMGWECLLHR
ncbi:hypothetical protein VTO42DRAFT_9023 [Malbranchea cinnamomea]